MKLPDILKSRKFILSLAICVLSVGAWLVTGRDHTLYGTLTTTLLGVLVAYCGGNVIQTHVETKAINKTIKTDLPEESS